MKIVLVITPTMAGKKMTLSKLYKYTTVYPAIIAIISSSMVSVYENQDYKSEWVTPEASTVMGIIATVIYSLIVSVFCLGIFLNGVEKVRNNFLWSLLSWFLFPYGWIIVSIINTVLAPYPSYIGYIYLVTVNAPFIVGLAWTFILFRRKLKQIETGNDI